MIREAMGRAFVARLVAGDALLNAAGLLAAAGRRVLGRPEVHAEEALAHGSTVLPLDRPIPAITKGLRIIGETSDEIVRVQGIQGRLAMIDRPLAQDYPRGAVVRVLI